MSKSAEKASLMWVVIVLAIMSIAYVFQESEANELQQQRWSMNMNDDLKEKLRKSKAFHKQRLESIQKGKCRQKRRSNKHHAHCPDPDETKTVHLPEGFEDQFRHWT